VGSSTDASASVASECDSPVNDVEDSGATVVDQTGQLLPVRLLRLGQLLRQLIKRGLLLPGNLRCLDMLRLPRT
jgi:hypothetical protein